MNPIHENLADIRQRVELAATAAGRNPDEIRLIAVSKFVPAEALSEAMRAGQFRFGENYLQEALEKQALLNNNRAEWHFIGHLQTNKAKQAAGKFSWLHGLDNLKLAERLSAALPDSDEPLNVLLQVNIADDPGKSGLQPADVLPFAESLLEAVQSGIRLRGLMTIGRQHAGVNERCADFAALRTLSEQCGERLGRDYFSELSMGMSDDFELAIREGSTMLRIGSSIFGARPPHNQ
jgi:PLP dependent protein